MRVIKIEKGIPIPEKSKKKLYADIPWKSLEIGDSFVWESKTVAFMKKAARANGIEIAIKQLTTPLPSQSPGPTHTFRIWRIA